MELYSALTSLSLQVPTEPRTDESSRPSIWAYGRSALRLAMQEKEVFFFAALQWISIVVAYLVCIELINYLPEFQPGYEPVEGESRWQSNAILWAGIMTGVVAAALPVGVLTGAMSASHFLRHHGRESTVASCLALSAKRTVRLWVFHAVDGAITVFRILDRLSKKDKNSSGAAEAAKETTYFAWKVACASAVPTLLLANQLSAAMKSSAAFLRHDLLRITALRAAYSAACWGVAGITMLLVVPIRFIFPAGSLTIYDAYLVAAIPFAVGLAILMLVLRPIYVLSLCEMYTDFITLQEKERGQQWKANLQAAHGRAQP